MKALIIIAEKFEDSQLLVPLYWLQEEGIKVDIAARSKGIIRGLRGYEVEACKTIDEIRPDDYSLLMLTGGKIKRAITARTLAVTRYFARKNKVVAAACEGIQALISAGVLRSRRAAYHRSIILTEIFGAGVLFEDRNVVVDGRIVTCRQTADLPIFSRAMIDLIEREKWYHTLEDVLAPCMN